MTPWTKEWFQMTQIKMTTGKKKFCLFLHNLACSHLFQFFFLMPPSGISFHFRHSAFFMHFLRIFWIFSSAFLLFGIFFVVFTIVCIFWPFLQMFAFFMVPFLHALASSWLLRIFWNFEHFWHFFQKMRIFTHFLCIFFRGRDRICLRHDGGQVSQVSSPGCAVIWSGSVAAVGFTWSDLFVRRQHKIPFMNLTVYPARLLGCSWQRAPARVCVWVVKRLSAVLPQPFFLRICQLRISSWMWGGGRQRPSSYHPIYFETVVYPFGPDSRASVCGQRLRVVDVKMLWRWCGACRNQQTPHCQMVEHFKVVAFVGSFWIQTEPHFNCCRLIYPSLPWTNPNTG